MTLTKKNFHCSLIKVNIPFVIIFCIYSISLITSLWVKNGEFQQIDLAMRLCPPSPKHILGCDLMGRDLLSSLIWGSQKTLLIATVTVFITGTIGTGLGLISGYFKGFLDRIITRLIDILMAFPGILIALTLASLLGSNTYNIILAISVTGWTSFARIIRAQVLTLSQREYIEACKALGASHSSIIINHLLPSCLPLLIITCAFSFSSVILIESSLSFLGLGVADNQPTWGSLLNQGKSVLLEAPLLSIAPGFLIFIMVLCFNLLGDKLRKILDPKN